SHAHFERPHPHGNKTDKLNLKIKNIS
uniref:Uncharacterized protein n=1 Tax=Amphimedon queenslandica TaxID=400682 RepID=A0A1X7T3K1_AMPQE